MLGIGYLFRKLFGLVTRPASEVTAHNPIAPFVPPSDEAWRHLSKRDALAVWGLQQYADELIDLAEPAVRLEIAPIDQANLTAGQSRLGGLPDLPPAHPWPTWRGKPMGFIAQIRLSDVAATWAESGLPHRGYLYFWFDLNEQPWGSEIGDAGGFRVEFVEDESIAVVTRELPKDYAWLDQSTFGSRTFTPCVVKCNRISTLPDANSELDWDPRIATLDIARYSDFCEAIGRRSRKTDGFGHQLRGYPWCIQGEMREECAEKSRVLIKGDAATAADTDFVALRRTAPEWLLLAQFDSDETTGFAWGDAGIIYYWIRRSDLQERRFDRIWGILQCF
jgi:uncharacterized protein YwqG